MTIEVEGLAPMVPKDYRDRLEFTVAAEKVIKDRISGPQ
jgi:hypothetical protein